MIKDQILTDLKQVLEKLKLTPDSVLLEHPADPKNGDYATNVALQQQKVEGGKAWHSPLELAKKIVETFPKTEYLEKIETAGPGFINFYLKQEWFVQEISKILEQGAEYGKAEKTGKKIAIELVSPNINKPLHIGHLRNGALGMAISEIYKSLGWEVVRDEINNDRGLHIMKSCLGYLLFGKKNQVGSVAEWQFLIGEWAKNPGLWFSPDETSEKPDQFVGKYYVLGEQYLEENKEKAEKQLSEMLLAWEAEEPKIWQLWKIMGDWVHEGINQTYERFGIKHDKKWYEYLLYKEGKEIIIEGLNNGVFEKLPDGAVQANLEKHGLGNKVLMRKDGTAIYMTFDIALTKHKVEEFKADQYVWVVGRDQMDHFKRLFAIFELLGLGQIESFYHLAYGMVRLPGGKMSSRLGNVILADDLLDKMRELAKELMVDRKIGVDLTTEEKERIPEAVGVGAVKYTMLRVNPLTEAIFDLEQSVSLEGDSGPYLQYTYARCRSVLEKAGQLNFTTQNLDFVPDLTEEESGVLQTIYKFPEIIEEAAKTFSPNLVCSFVFALAQRFNLFYNNQSILKSAKEEREFRLCLTVATAQVLKNGLNLLGVEVLERM